VIVGEIERSLGGPDRPLSDEQLLTKFYGNCGGQSPQAEQLAQRILNLAAEKDLIAIHQLVAELVHA
jgi:hypothetical protein